jgi:hypothetical protein
MRGHGHRLSTVIEKMASNQGETELLSGVFIAGLLA